MPGKDIVAFGIFSIRTNAEDAVDRLKIAGYRNTDISVLFPHTESSRTFALERNTKAPEGAVAGAGAGAVVGGALGWLASVGILVIPGVGPFIAAGPIMAALAGIGVGGAVGGIGGALVGMGIPEHAAKRYEGRIKKGGILLSVHCDNYELAKRAETILYGCGAEDISSTVDIKAACQPRQESAART